MDEKHEAQGVAPPPAANDHTPPSDDAILAYAGTAETIGAIIAMSAGNGNRAGAIYIVSRGLQLAIQELCDGSVARAGCEADLEAVCRRVGAEVGRRFKGKGEVAELRAAVDAATQPAGRA